MASIFPATPPEGTPSSEMKLRERLATIDGLIVLHSVAWQGIRNGRPSDGEADFVVVHPRRGILLLEVKGGEVEIEGGSWYSTDRRGVRHRIKNPFEQVVASKHPLLEYLRGINPSFRSATFCHAVVFPDITVPGAMGPNAPREIILDRPDLDNVAKSLNRVFDHWKAQADLGSTELEQLIAALAPTVKVRRLLRDRVADSNQELIHLTQEQMCILNNLRRTRKALILGGAGTGKTILAVEKAKQLSSSGFRTLLVCYNSPLQKCLAEVIGSASGVEVRTFHSLVLNEAKKARIGLPQGLDADWYERQAAQTLMAVSEKNGPQFDAILVDEAQDFAIQWIEALRTLLVPSGIIYLFADSHQDLYRRDWSEPVDLLPYELTLNCRNTGPIAQRVASIFGEKILGPCADGPAPVFVEIERKSDFPRLITAFVDRLILEEGITPNQIAIMTDDMALIQDLRSRIVADVPLSDLDSMGIPVETIYRFKGLERDVIVLSLSDRVIGDGFSAVAYVALSRARAALYIFGSKEVKGLLKW